MPPLLLTITMTMIVMPFTAMMITTTESRPSRFRRRPRPPKAKARRPSAAGDGPRRAAAGAVGDEGVTDTLDRPESLPMARWSMVTTAQSVMKDTDLEKL